MAVQIRAKLKDGKVWFTYPYNYGVNATLKQFGAKFVDEKKGGPAYTVKADFDIMRRVQKEFGSQLVIDHDLYKWANSIKEQRSSLMTLSAATSAELGSLPELNPALYAAVHVGPRGKDMDEEAYAKALAEPASFQAADVAFMKHCPNPMNTNQPGTGKTVETIAALFESGYHTGAKLIIAPLTSLDTVWLEELTKWGGGQPVYMPRGSMAERMAVLEDVQVAVECEMDFWVIINHDMIKMSKTRVVDEDNNWLRDELSPKYPMLFDTHWNAVVLDEFHKSGTTNTQTMAFKGLDSLNGNKKIVLSGTPIGGQPIKFWAMLHWLYPQDFTSKWAWANHWLEVAEVEDSRGKRRKIGDVRSNMRKQFDEHIGPYILRRTKAEVLPWLPPKQHIDIAVEMGPKQAEQYRAMAEDAEWRMDEDTKIAATSILAEYTRLKQFANAFSILGPYIDAAGTKRKVIPTTDSCKLPAFMQILEERGITSGDLAGEEQVVFFSQFSEMVDMVCDYLDGLRIPTARITGAVSERKRSQNIRDFRGGESDRPRVMGITTTAGGVAINLDTASTVVFFDETWNPDDQEQAEDRCHRASRIHQVTIYKIFTKDSIEGKIRSVLTHKDNINKRILDLRRSGLRAV